MFPSDDCFLPRLEQLGYSGRFQPKILAPAAVRIPLGQPRSGSATCFCFLCSSMFSCFWFQPAKAAQIALISANKNDLEAVRIWAPSGDCCQCNWVHFTCALLRKARRDALAPFAGPVGPVACSTENSLWKVKGEINRPAFAPRFLSFGELYSSEFEVRGQSKVCSFQSRSTVPNG